MNLPCIYALKTRDAQWVSRFYPVRRLREEFSKLGVEFCAYLPEDADAVFSQLSAQAAQGARPVCILRGELSDTVLDAACKTGALCINAPPALKKAQDKLTAYRLLTEAGLPVPRTITAPPLQGNTGDYALIIEKHCQKAGIAFPAVIKPRRGSRGRDVRLAQTPAEAAALILEKTCANSAHLEMLIQEYLPFSRGRDVRVFVTGGKAIAAAERARDLSRAPEWEIRSNASEGGSFFHLSGKPAQKREWLEDTACRVSASFGLFYATVDFIFRSEDELLVCEVNGSPGFEAFERGIGVNIAGALAKAIISYSREAALAP